MVVGSIFEEGSLVLSSIHAWTGKQYTFISDMALGVVVLYQILWVKDYCICGVNPNPIMYDARTASRYNKYGFDHSIYFPVNEYLRVEYIRKPTCTLIKTS